jgi:hypothetical protein
MKTVFAMILMLALYDASAVEIKVKRMHREPGYEARYELKTSLDAKVVLDCQSFIQGLLVGELGEDVVMLQEWECQELLLAMKKSLHSFKHHCMEVDFDRSVLDTQQACP